MKFKLILIVITIFFITNIFINIDINAQYDPQISLIRLKNTNYCFAGFGISLYLDNCSYDKKDQWFRTNVLGDIRFINNGLCISGYNGLYDLRNSTKLLLTDCNKSLFMVFKNGGIGPRKSKSTYFKVKGRVAAPGSPIEFWNYQSQIDPLSNFEILKWTSASQDTTGLRLPGGTGQPPTNITFCPIMGTAGTFLTGIPFLVGDACSKIKNTLGW